MSNQTTWGRKVRQGLGMAALVLALLLFAPVPALQAFVFAVVLLGAWEWSRVANLGSPVTRTVYSIAAALPAVLDSWLLADRPLPSAVAHGLAAAWLLPLAFIVACERSSKPIPHGRELPLHVPSPLVALTGLLVLTPFGIVNGRMLGRLEDGNLWFLLALTIVAAVDTFGQLVGRHGRRRLVPVVSPNKTWEGLAAGIAGAALVGAVASLWNRLDLAEGALLGLAAGAASVVGDLTASVAKRNVPVKDFSALLGQHGGVMDRVDGHLAAAPLVASFLVAAGLPL